MPIDPDFAMTAHKAQGQTIEMVVVDLAGCTGTEQPYVMVSRSTYINSLIILRDFDFGQVTKRRSEDLRKESARLEDLRLRTIVHVKYWSEDKARHAESLLGSRKINNVVRKRKRAPDDDVGRQKKRERQRRRERSWALPLAGAITYDPFVDAQILPHAEFGSLVESSPHNGFEYQTTSSISRNLRELKTSGRRSVSVNDLTWDWAYGKPKELIKLTARRVVVHQVTGVVALTVRSEEESGARSSGHKADPCPSR